MVVTVQAWPVAGTGVAARPRRVPGEGVTARSLRVPYVDSKALPQGTAGMRRCALQGSGRVLIKRVTRDSLLIWNADAA